MIAKHKLCHGKGQLIQDRQHTRDRTKGINAYIHTVAGYFNDDELAQSFLKEVRSRHPRYIRDQLDMILRQIKRTKQQEIMDAALKECVNKRLFCATDFVDMVQYMNRQRQVYVTKPNENDVTIKSLYVQNESFIQTTTQKRDVNEYLSVLEGHE